MFGTKTKRNEIYNETEFFASVQVNNEKTKPCLVHTYTRHSLGDAIYKFSFKFRRVHSTT